MRDLFLLIIFGVPVNAMQSPGVEQNVAQDLMREFGGIRLLTDRAAQTFVYVADMHISDSLQRRWGSS
jgi:hypothetical protein